MRRNNFKISGRAFLIWKQLPTAVKNELNFVRFKNN